MADVGSVLFNFSRQVLATTRYNCVMPNSHFSCVCSRSTDDELTLPVVLACRACSGWNHPSARTR